MKQLALACLMSLLLVTPALAIPVAGDYVFVTGDQNISGSFTSTGSSLSAWSYSSDVFSRLFLGPSFPDTTQSWNSQTDVLDPFHAGPTNDAQTFHTATNGNLLGYASELQWNANPSILTAIFGVNQLCCDAFYQAPTVSFVSANAQTVPVPDMLWITALGLVGAGLLGWRRAHP